MTRYIVITPVRNEEEYLTLTIASILQQTIRPAEWLLVDDGSTDDTGTIIDEYASKFSWIRAIHRPNRGYRKSGGGVVEAFYDGYNSLECDDWDFVVKLDGDLSFAADYFEKCFEQFESSPQLGIGGGSLHHMIGGELKFEPVPKFHVRGATKIYRRACWLAIEALWPAAGWDTIDEVKANMLGWATRTFPDIPLVHHRLTGTADGLWSDSVKHGLACYIARYHPLFLIASCAYRVRNKPYLVGAVGTFYGFLKGCFTRVPRPDDKSYSAYIHRQQLRRLFGGETIWR